MNGKSYRLHTKKNLNVSDLLYLFSLVDNTINVVTTLFKVVELSVTNNFSFDYPMLNRGDLPITVECFADGAAREYLDISPKTLILKPKNFEPSFVHLSLSKPTSDKFLSGYFNLNCLVYVSSSDYLSYFQPIAPQGCRGPRSIRSEYCCVT